MHAFWAILILAPHAWFLVGKYDLCTLEGSLITMRETYEFLSTSEELCGGVCVRAFFLVIYHALARNVLRVSVVATATWTFVYRRGLAHTYTHALTNTPINFRNYARRALNKFIVALIINSSPQNNYVRLNETVSIFGLKQACVRFQSSVSSLFFSLALCLSLSQQRNLRTNFSSVWFLCLFSLVSPGPPIGTGNERTKSLDKWNEVK